LLAEAPGYAGYKGQFADGDTNIWVPFTSQLDWEMAHWAKLCGPGSTALSELLKIDGVSGLESAIILMTWIASGLS
jgi:hypothetical protein